MTRKEACRILGIAPDAPASAVKKRYRQLIHQLHPDAGRSPGREYPYNVREIILAYAELKKSVTAGEKQSGRDGRTKTARKKEPAAWSAPLNPQAYREREILHYAEDSDGTVIGNFTIARGKYLWTAEEDFPLFLLSLFRCSALLLDEIDAAEHRGYAPSGRQAVQAELSYLLAQQFTDAPAMLAKFAGEPVSGPDGRPVFCMPAMLESAGPSVPLPAGELLYPAGLRRHRLYLKNRAGQELGYLSFRDDRLYYVVIPLFEQRRVQVRIRVSEKQPEEHRRKPAGYRNLLLQLRFSGRDRGGHPESLNLQIEQLLEIYRRSGAMK